MPSSAIGTRSRVGVGRRGCLLADLWATNNARARSLRRGDSRRTVVLRTGVGRDGEVVAVIMEGWMLNETFELLRRIDPCWSWSVPRGHHPAALSPHQPHNVPWLDASLAVSRVEPKQNAVPSSPQSPPTEIIGISAGLMRCPDSWLSMLRISAIQSLTSHPGIV